MFGEFWGCLAASGCCVAKMKARKKSEDLYINYIMILISKNAYLLLLYHKILIYILSRQQSDASANFSRFWQLVEPAVRHGETQGLLTHDDTCFGGKGWKAPPQGGKPPPRWAPLKVGGIQVIKNICKNEDWDRLRPSEKSRNNSFVTIFPMWLGFYCQPWL